MLKQLLQCFSYGKNFLYGNAACKYAGKHVRVNGVKDVYIEAQIFIPKRWDEF